MMPISWFVAYRFKNGGAFSLWTWYDVFGALGCLLWIAAYVLVVRRAYQDKAHGIPGPAICLNLGWEILTSFKVWADPVDLWVYFDIGWLAIDVVIASQLLMYGRALQKNAFVRRYFYLLFAGGVILSVAWQYLFARVVDDKAGMITAFCDNLVMSALFVALYYTRRPRLAGLSLAAAWTKMLGTVGTAVMGLKLFPIIFPYKASYKVLVPMRDYMIPLYAAIFVLDAVYTFLLWRGQRASSLAPGAVEAAAA